MTLKRRRRLSRSPFLQAMGERVRERRYALDLSLRDLRDRTDRSLAFLCDVENGHQEPGAASLWRLARALGVTIDWIVHGGEEEAR